MRLIRSWPLNPPGGRARVEDDAERLYNENYDYRGLADVGDDVLHIDWDTAVAKEDLESFAALARRHRDDVLVAPIPVYPDSRRGLTRTIWNLKRYDGPHRMRYVEIGEPTCHLFGFGMLYLPRDLINGFIDAHRDRLDSGELVFGDMAFAGWHHRNIREETRIDWSVRPIHLHYSAAAVRL